jgi:gas vesicle protein
MLRKRYYILFVARDEDGRVRKIPLPLHYVYGFVAAALVGAFTIVGLAGSYTRMLLKTESYNQVRQERETLRKNYKQMAQIAHDRDVQVASLGALASEVTTLYGLRQNKLNADQQAANPITAPTPQSLALSDEVNQQAVKLSIDQFYALREQAMSGRVTRALEGGLTPSFSGDWTQLADAHRSGRLRAVLLRASVSARIHSTEKAPSIQASTLTRRMARRCGQPPMVT